MYTIEHVEFLSEDISRMVIRAPRIAKKIKPGQFIILRIDEWGERIPLTMNSADPKKGTITLVFQTVGATTKRLSQMKRGQTLLDFAGPMGNPTALKGAHHVCVVAGGLGSAIAYPQARWLHDAGAKVDVIMGFRNKKLIVLEKELAACSNRLTIMTDDGSRGNKGLVTHALQQSLDRGVSYDLVLAVGPVVMMKYVAATTKPYGLKTLVSMNPLMIDGTGMCGGCRVKVDGDYLHACVDGPDFDGHLVDFDDALRRGVMYRSFERNSLLKLTNAAVCEGRQHRDHAAEQQLTGFARKGRQHDCSL